MGRIDHKLNRNQSCDSGAKIVNAMGFNLLQSGRKLLNGNFGTLCLKQTETLSGDWGWMCKEPKAWTVSPALPLSSLGNLLF